METPEWVKTAKVGDKVVHVGGRVRGRGRADVSRGEAIKRGAVLPNRGSVYTIRKINVCSHDTLILLNEIDNSHLIGVWGGTIEPGFSIYQFRPVQPRKTDISVFERLLHTVPAELEDA